MNSVSCYVYRFNFIYEQGNNIRNETILSHFLNEIVKVDFIEKSVKRLIVKNSAYIFQLKM